MNFYDMAANQLMQLSTSTDSAVRDAAQAELKRRQKQHTKDLYRAYLRLMQTMDTVEATDETSVISETMQAICRSEQFGDYRLDGILNDASKNRADSHS